VFQRHHKRQQSGSDLFDKDPVRKTDHSDRQKPMARHGAQKCRCE